MYYHHFKACQVQGFLSCSQMSLKHRSNYKTETPENCRVNGCTLHSGDQLILHLGHDGKSLSFRNLGYLKLLYFSLQQENNGMYWLVFSFMSSDGNLLSDLTVVHGLILFPHRNAHNSISEGPYMTTKPNNLKKICSKCFQMI